MAEGIFVTRGTEKKFIRPGDIDSHIADGWKPASDVAVDTAGSGRSSLVAADEFAAVEDFSAAGGGRGELVAQDEVESAVDERFKQEAYDTFANEALAAASGVGSALTLGASDAAISALGGREQLENITSVNPFARAGGEVAGAIGGAVLGGGSSLGRFLPGALATRGATAAGKLAGARGGTVAALATEGALDGALFGAGQAYANAVIADKPINAENIIGAMSSEALYGGAFGGALGAAVGGLGKLSRKIKAGELKVTRAADDLTNAQRAADNAAEAVARAKPGKQAAKAQAVLDKANAKAARLAASEADGSVRQLNSFADELTNVPDVLTSKPEAFNKHIESVVARELANPEAANKAAVAYAKIGAPKLDPAEFSQFANDLGIAVPATPGAEALAQAYVARKAIDDVSLAATSKTAAKQAKHSTELALNEQTKFSEVAKEKTLTGLQLREAKRVAGSNAPSAPGQLSGLVGNKLGGMYRAISHGPQKIKSGVSSFIKFAGKPRRGTVPAASVVLSKIKFDPELGEKPAKTRHENIARITRELDSVAQNPAKARARIQEALGEINTLKPGLAAQLSEKAFQRMMLLHSVLPRNPRVSAFGKTNWRPTQTEIGKFARIAAAAEDPYSILDDLERGTITQEAVDTVKQLYPEIYHNIQMELVNSAEEIKERVGYQGRLRLGILFQAPTDEVLEPSFIAAMQQNYAIRTQEQEQAGGSSQYSTPGNNQQAIASTATTSQRLEVAK